MVREKYGEGENVMLRDIVGAGKVIVRVKKVMATYFINGKGKICSDDT